jgi:hypothetical protein
MKNRNYCASQAAHSCAIQKDASMTTMRNTVAATWMAVAAGTIGFAASAHADTEYYFRSPSGNTACEMIGAVDGTATAVCKLKDHTWPAPVAAGGQNCEYSGYDLKLFQGQLPCAGVWPSQIFMEPGYATLPTLSYGQSHTMGEITCASEPSDVTCTDASTGHFFRVSRESYQLG